MELADSFILAQIFGFIGYGIYIVSSWMKTRFKLLTLEAVGCFVIGMHWFLLSMPTIGLMNLVYVYMGVVSLLIVRFPKTKWMLALSFPLLLGITVSSWQGTDYGLVAVIATCFGLCATFLAILSKYCLDMFKLRSLSMVSSLMWVACGVLASSIPQIFACGVFAVGHMVGIYMLVMEGRRPLRAVPVVSKDRRF